MFLNVNKYFVNFSNKKPSPENGERRYDLLLSYLNRFDKSMRIEVIAPSVTEDIPLTYIITYPLSCYFSPYPQNHEWFYPSLAGDGLPSPTRLS